MTWIEILLQVANGHNDFRHGETIAGTTRRRCTFVFAHDGADLADHYATRAHYPTLQALQTSARLERNSTVMEHAQTGFAIVRSAPWDDAQQVADAQEANKKNGYQVLAILEHLMEEECVGLDGFDISGTRWVHEEVQADNLVKTTFFLNYSREAFDPYGDIENFYTTP